ncbi:MAG: hypothetical protein ABIR46_04480 [Candidatus Saccharimonadales bacterium]
MDFAAVDRAFTGHRLCSAVPWVTNPDSSGKLHATVEGQQAYAVAVSTKLAG